MKKSKSVMPRLVADDNGYAAHKFAWFDSDGKIMTGKIEALIQIGGQGISSPDGRLIGSYRVGGDLEFTCSVAVSNPMKLRTAEYPVKPENRVLFTHGLTRFGLLGMPVKAAVTLPFRDFFMTDGTINESLKAACKENFEKGDVEVVGSGAQPEVVNVDVYAEALSALFDWAFDDEGGLTDGWEEMVETSGEVLIVDIGGSTTDIVSLHMTNEPSTGDMTINHGKSGTERVGVMDAISALDELVRNVMTEEGVEGLRGHTGALRADEVERILRTGRSNYNRQPWDFKTERDIACRGVAQRINSYIKSLVQNPSAYMAILVVGGGSIVFKEWLDPILPNATFMDEYANARGVLKFMRRKENGQG